MLQNEARNLLVEAYEKTHDAMDKLRTHHIQAVAVLRKLRVRSSNALDAAIRFALDQVSADDCAGWFSCAGYCLF